MESTMESTMETRKDYAHFLPLDVRWGDADALGHINNVQYVRYIESARVDYAKVVNDLNFEAGIEECWILADLQCSYVGQLHYPCHIEVATRTSKLGNSSAVLIASIFVEDKDEPVFTSKAVVVWFDYINQKTMRIPDVVREEVNSYETIKPEAD